MMIVTVIMAHLILQYEAKLDNLIYISKWLWKDVVIITNAKMSVISCSFLTEKAHEIGY